MQVVYYIELNKLLSRCFMIVLTKLELLHAMIIKYDVYTLVKMLEF